MLRRISMFGKRGSIAAVVATLGTLLCGSSVEAQTVVFSESFDGGLGQFDANGRVYTGSYGVRMRGGAGPANVVSDPIDTTGLSGITLTFTRDTDGLDFGETAVSAFSTDGASWTIVELATSTQQTVSFGLGPAADDQATLYIAFQLDASSFYETFEVDDVVVTAAGGEPDPDPDPDPEPDPDPDNPLARGPDPTTAALEAGSGPFAVGSYRPSSTPGFGAGTIWYPTGTSEGPFAAVAVVPGYTGGESTISWVGQKLASHGFVAITISTNSIYDFPSSRASQLLAALDTVVAQSNSSSSPISGLVDPSRRGVSGHSMGGGGSLIAAESDPSLDAVVPLAPWNSSDNFSDVEAPTLIVACEEDGIASVSSHALPFYNSIPFSVDKAFLEFNNEDHFCPLSGNDDAALMGKYIVSWMKRFLDQDTRYDPFLCGAPHQADLQGSDISDYRDTCPY